MPSLKTRRNLELATIHVAKKQLCMDDETYRAMLWTIARVRSAADADYAGRRRVIDHLARCGAKIASNASRRGDPAAAKMRALWLDLHARGVVRDESDRALGAFVQRQTGVAAIKWLSGAQAGAVVEALKAWLARCKTDA